mgnify:CR=1 FL=1
MRESEAKRQLCKIQGEVADRLGVKSRCVCDDAHGFTENAEVPDEIISELWELIADGYLFRYVREIFRKERPKGRRLNLEELDEAPEPLPIQQSRWAMLRKTSNSGKTLFSCTVCGRVSTTPDKTCKTFEDPAERWGCSKIDECSTITESQERAFNSLEDVKKPKKSQTAGYWDAIRGGKD